MKFISSLFICINVAAITLCNCDPDDCTRSAERNCSAGKNNDWVYKRWPENETELNEDCSGDMIPVVNCYIGIGERCPNSLSALFLKSRKERIELYNQLCSNGTMLRESFLQNIDCLNEEFQATYDECRLTENNEESREKNCTYNEDHLECDKRNLAAKCGVESASLYNELMKHLISESEEVCNYIAMMK